MNTTIESIAADINDIIQREMEFCKEDGINTTYTEQLEHILSEIKETATFLYYPDHKKA